MSDALNHWARKLLSVLAVSALAVLIPTVGVAQQPSPLRIEGRVRDAGGASIPGAAIELNRSKSSDSEPTETESDQAGQFSILAQTAGTYSLRVTKAGYRDTTEIITVPFLQPHSCEIVLIRSGTPAADDSLRSIQFSDKPDFTVAGITDWTAAGGHGSDVRLRTSEALAQDTRVLETTKSADRHGNSQDLRLRRDQLQNQLVKNESSGLHRELGDLDEQMNDSLAAVHEYERAAELDSSEQNYFAWATELLLHRAIQPAVEVFSKGVALYPGSERMLAGLGASLYASGLYAQAAERLCAASDLKPTDATPYLFLGKMVEASSEPLPCSQEKLARFVREQPGSASAYYYYALALSKTSATTSVGEVEALLKKSISIDPGFTRAHVRLGIVYSERSQNDKAIAEYEKAKAADPNLAEARFRLGQAYKKTGELAKARQEFQAYAAIQKSQAASVDQQRREIQQFVIVFQDHPQIAPNP
jgi:tetratricopeptide (TPR) repeat protein